MENELNEQLDLMRNNIKKMEEIKSYEIAKLIRSYNYQISNLYYYYKVIEKNNKELSKLKKSIKSHTLIYINLGRGFPKELMDGHLVLCCTYYWRFEIIRNSNNKYKNKSN